MDAKYLVGIPEIDAQHEEISNFVAALQGVMVARNQQHLIRPTLSRLSHLLVAHFECEEALMRMVDYAELPVHQKMHRGVLKLFDDYFTHPPAPGEFEPLGKVITDRVLGHVMEHDIQMTRMVREYLATSRGCG